MTTLDVFAGVAAQLELRTGVVGDGEHRLR